MRGDTFAGSMSWTTGQGAESRFIYISGTGQKNRVLTVSASNPDPVNPTDTLAPDRQPMGRSLFLQIKTVKTAHVDAISFSGTGGIKRIYGWAGLDDLHPGMMKYLGTGSTLPWIFQDAPGAAYHQCELNAGALMVNSEVANATGYALALFGRGGAGAPADMWMDGLGWVGVILQFKPITGTTPTGVNTWTIECTWGYGDS